MRKLLFFTTNYPYDRGEQWKTNELKILKKYFEITVIPFHSKKNVPSALLFDDVKYEKPLFKELPYKPLWFRFIAILFSRFTPVFINEFIEQKIYTSKINFLEWIRASYRIVQISKNKRLIDYIKNPDKNTILYFYWARESSEILPFVSFANKKRIIVRFHGYDLYEDRKNGYMAYRKLQLKNIGTAVFISKQGMNYLKSKYHDLQFNAKLFRLGTISSGKALISNDEKLRIFSCSNVIPLKRVDLIAKSIMKLNFPVIWTHIGDGDNLNDVKNITDNPPENITINLVGKVPSNKVLNFYINQYADLFINVSTTEGVPVSIMEAISAGIPVFATNVGGTSEIVDENIGKLLKPDLTDNYLSNEITNFYKLSVEKKLKLRKNAFNRYQTMCNAEILEEQFADYLKNL